MKIVKRKRWEAAPSGQYVTAKGDVLGKEDYAMMSIRKSEESPNRHGNNQKRRGIGSQAAGQG